MFDSIPLPVYSPIFFHLMLVIIIITWMSSFQTTISNPSNLKKKQLLGVSILIFILFYMGLRPVSGRFFGDMSTYATVYMHYANHDMFEYNQDWGFDTFMKICANTIPLNGFFMLCAFIYTYPLYLLSKRLFEDYWYYSFLILVGSFSFWAYGTNGIRNGLATSLTLLAFAYTDKKVIMITLMVIATSFHKSVLIPIMAYICTLFYNDSRNILYLWLLCIPVSAVSAGAFESFIGHLGLNDSRTSYLTDGNVNNDTFSSTGFRWDFLAYSAIGTFTGWYFIFKRGFKDVLYIHLYNIYLITNAFWILVIRANFSNRFAYLSWFMIGLIVIYPFLKEQFFVKQHKAVCSTILLYYMFTYVLNAII